MTNSQSGTAISISRSRALRWCWLYLAVLLPACVQHQYQPAPVDTASMFSLINSWSIDNPELKQFLLDNGLAPGAIDSREFGLERLFLTGLFYQPEIQTAYRQLRKARVVAEHAGYRFNPELSIPLEHHSDTSDGRSAWTIGAVLGFIYERRGKREARQAGAELDILNARLHMDRLATALYSEVEQQYMRYQLSHAMRSEIAGQVEVLRELLGLLQDSLELGAVSPFELSSLQLELQQRLFEQNLEENTLQGHRDRLFALTQLSQREYAAVEPAVLDPLQFVRKFYREFNGANSSVAELRTTLLETHPDLAQRLNDYARAEAALRLEIENQYPDIVLSPGFIFDQSDNIWTLGAAWILPLFPDSKQNLAILKAMEDRSIRQQEIIVLQKSLLDRFYNKYNAVQRFDKSIHVSDEILTSVEQRADELRQQIELGGADRIALLRNRMEYFRARVTQLQIYRQAVNEILAFRHLLQITGDNRGPLTAVRKWLENTTRGENDEPAG